MASQLEKQPRQVQGVLQEDVGREVPDALLRPFALLLSEIVSIFVGVGLNVVNDKFTVPSQALSYPVRIVVFRAYL